MCEFITLSIQNFVCYYLQLVKPYAMMFYRVSHKHFLMLRLKLCLLIFLSLMYFTVGVQCDQGKNTKTINRLATNESLDLLTSVSIARVTIFASCEM